MSVKFSEFSIGTIGADLEIVGYDSATPTNVQVSYSDLKIDILGDAGTVTSIATTGPITGGTITGSGTIGITQATVSTAGYLSSTDWGIFNSKQNALTLTTTGTSGAATLIGSTLNIPQYVASGGGGMAIGGAITSATAGSVLFVGTGGVLQQNNANFFWDNTNSRLQVTGSYLVSNGTVAQNVIISNRKGGTSSGFNIFIGDGGASVTGTGIEGSNNASLGHGALFNTTIGHSNVAIGNASMNLNTTGRQNVSVGVNSLQNQTTGNLNTAVGFQSLQRMTSGSSNTAIGLNSGFNITTGVENTAIGYEAMSNTTTTTGNVAVGWRSLNGVSSNYNSAVGYASSTSLTGTESTSVGAFALRFTTSGNQNIGIGYNAGSNNTTGSNNIFIGTSIQAVLATASNRTFIGTDTTTSTWLGGNLLLGSKTDDGVYRLQVTGGAKTTTDCNINTHTLGRGLGNIQSNTVFGYQALNSNTTGDGNTAIGYWALKANTGAYLNTAVGAAALSSNTGGSFNTAIGGEALLSCTTAGSNTAIGARAAKSLTTAGGVIAIGSGAFQNGIAGNNIYIGSNSGSTHSNAACIENVLVGNDTGTFSSTMRGTTAIGINALWNTSTGNNNVAVGFDAGRGNTTGSNNVFIGYQISPVSATDSNRTFIGNGSTTSTWLGGRLLLGSTTDNGTDILQVTGSALVTGVFKQTVTTNRQTASYSLVLLDRGKLVEMNVATANNLTVPASGTINFPIGTQIDISQYGAGQTTVVAAVGVTVRSAAGALKLASQYSGGSLVKIGTDEWYLFGDITV
jgi:hypothetical protein